MKANINDDLEALSKNLYLESPDLWIEFLDKVNGGIFDELVLFFATKYNYISILKYAINNNLININSKSRNKDFATIYDHLVYVAKQNNYEDISSFFDSLKNPNKEVSKENTKSKKRIATENKEDAIIPSVICKNCNSNIFEVGYIVCENKIFKYSSKEKKPIEISKEELNSVICCNCNSLIDNTTPSDLDALCNITTCINCKGDLRNTGIIDKRNLIYNKESNTFDLGNTYYACGKCEKEISNQQKSYFGLK